MHKKSRNKKHRLERRKGTSVVELAVTSPLLLLLLLGTIDGGQFANCYQIISDASREGARVAVRSTTSNATEVNNSVMDYLSGAFPNVSTAELNAAVTIDVRNTVGTSLANLASVPSGAAVRVDVSMQFDAIRYIPGLSALDNRTVQITTIMRRE